MLNEEHLSRIFFAAVNHKMNTENTDSLRLLREYISETIELSSEFTPAEITDLCAPASTDYNKEKPPKKDEIDTRVSNK